MSNKISRRNFLHTAGLGTLGAAAAGLLTSTVRHHLPMHLRHSPTG